MSARNDLFRKRHTLISRIQELETLAYEAEFPMAAHTLNNAKNVAGWEFAGDRDRAEMAMRGERPKG